MVRTFLQVGTADSSSVRGRADSLLALGQSIPRFLKGILTVVFPSKRKIIWGFLNNTLEHTRNDMINLLF